jgi:hypothetical protein
MARLANYPISTRESDLPDADKFKLALNWLRNNPSERPATASKIWKLEKPKSHEAAWRRERKKKERGDIRRRGYNKILIKANYRAIIEYAIRHATNGGKGATKQMIFQCVIIFRRCEEKPPPI